MIEIRLNDKSQRIEAQSLAQFLEQQDALVEQPFAVAINGDFVPRSAYADTALSDGDAIDIVSPIGGG